MKLFNKYWFKKHKKGVIPITWEGAIFVLDLFLGWTGIGWVVALIWSVANQSRVLY